MIATVEAVFALGGLLAQGLPIRKFPNVSVTEKNKTTVEISAMKDFIITTTSLLNKLHRHNIKDKNKTITFTKNFIEATETFIKKLHKDIRTVQMAPLPPPRTLALPPSPCTQYSRAVTVHVSSEPLPTPQMQGSQAVRQVPCRGNYIGQRRS